MAEIHMELLDVYRGYSIFLWIEPVSDLTLVKVIIGQKPDGGILRQFERFCEGPPHLDALKQELLELAREYVEGLEVERLLAGKDF